MSFDWFSSCIDELKLPSSPWQRVSDEVGRNLAYRIRLEGLTQVQLEKVSKFVGSDFMQKYHLFDLNESFSPTTERSTRLVKDVDVQNFLKDLTVKAASDCQCLWPVSSSSNEHFIEMVNIAKTVFHNNSLRVHQRNSDVSLESKRNGDAQTVVDILKNDPGSLKEVIHRLNGRSLPLCLRQYLYRLILVKKWKSASRRSPPTGDAQSSQQRLRAEFAASVKRGMAELKIRKPTETHLAYLISSSVATGFESNPGLRHLLDDVPLRRSCARVLNILYTHRREFESIYSHWLALLSTTFTEQASSKEHEYELAMWLDVVLSHCVPVGAQLDQIVSASWSAALKHSQKAASFADTDLGAAFERLGVAVSEEAVESIIADSEEILSKSKPRDDTLHPVVFIRQWVLSLFVGYLSLPCSSFIWDQLFLDNWSQKCFVRVCLTLIHSIAKSITECKSKVELIDLFSKNLVDLPLSDLRSSWRRLNELFPM